MKLVSNQITLKEAEDRIKKADIETAIKILDDKKLATFKIKETVLIY